MKADITVKQFIEVLKTLDQDAKVCIANLSDDINDPVFYSAVEGSKEIESQKYISNTGEELTGKILGLY